MVIIKPFKVLVCLAIVSLFAAVPVCWSYTGPDISGGVGIQGEALSADPALQPLPQTRSAPAQPLGNPFPQSYSQRSYRSQASNPSSPATYRLGQEAEPWPTAPAYGSAPAACPPEGCPPQPHQSGSLLPPFLGLFSQPGMEFGAQACSPFLPRIGCKQFSLSAKLWNAKFNASTVKWGTNTIGGEGTELDLHDDLGLRKHNLIPEYEARCQIRQNWGIRFSYMPYNFRDNTLAPFPYGFFFGNIFFPPSVPILTKWDRNVYRWDLVYDWYQRSHALSSIFAGYALYDDKLTISSPNVLFWSRTRSKGWGLAFAGLSLEKAIRVLGTGVASSNCKWSVQFCQGYFGWDGYAAARIAVPMDCGRFGYIECGWRWITLQRGYPSNTDKTSFDGLSGTVGLVF